MALFRVPSKKIQYGYIEVEIDVSVLTAAQAAAAYMSYVSEFQMAEIEYVEAKASPPKDFPKADEPTKQDIENANSVIGSNAPEDVQAAAQAVVDGLGATEVPDEEAPWDKAKKPEPVKQAWEVEAPVAAFDWN